MSNLAYLRNSEELWVYCFYEEDCGIYAPNLWREWNVSGYTFDKDKNALDVCFRKSSGGKKHY